MNRDRVRRIAIAAATGLGVIAVAISLFQDDEPPGPSRTTTTPSTVTAPGSAPQPAPAPPVAEWGDFAGAPPDLEAPPAGSLTTVPGDTGEVVTARRADGSVLATAALDDAGVPLEARYFDDAGELTLVASAVRTHVAGVASGGARVTCGSAASARSGFRWTAFPIRWRLGRALPRGIRRSAALAALRRARGVWNANRSHCRGIPDRSRARFAFAGATRRGTGRDGVNLVAFGDVDRLGGVCGGTVACTITWVGGGRAVESDVLIDRAQPGGYFVRAPRSRALDLQSVMVHESGHTLGLDHVNVQGVVMFPVISRGTVGGRRLGRGDALANNRLY